VPDLTAILPRLESHLGPPEGQPAPLDGGITNRNFRVRLGGRDYVVRLPGKDTDQLGIDRRAERLAAAQAAALRIGPELAYADEECSVTEFVPCRPVDPVGLGADPSGVGRGLRAFHDSGLELPTQFWIPALLVDYAAKVTDRGGALPAQYAGVQALVARIAERLPLDEPVPSHDDLLPGNLIVTDRGVLLVDWEYAGMGHRYFDLGNLAVNNGFDAAAEDRLLAAYLGAPPSDGQRAALALMKIVSDAREAAWGVIQGVLSDLDFDFAAYAADHFERLDRAAADPRLEDYLSAATP
jgi:aminoglycoside phosphotransferase (APT) family kinase protein